jgi:tetratricopeptide (TPR) repeat protein
MMEYLQQALEIHEIIGNKYDVAGVLHQIGLYYYALNNDFEKGLNYYCRVLEIYEDLGYVVGIYGMNHNIGFIQMLKGNYEEAITRIGQVIPIVEQRENKEEFAGVLTNLAVTYKEKGESDTAIEYFEKSLALREKTKSNRTIAGTYFWLISTAIDKNDLALAKKYWKQLQTCEKNLEDELVIQWLKISEALILSKETRPVKWLKGTEIIEELLQGEFIRQSFKYNALRIYWDLLLKEFQANGNLETLHELQELTTQIVEIAKEQQIYSMKLEAASMRAFTIWLRTLYSDATTDLVEVQTLLTELQLIADKKGLSRIAKKIYDDHHKLIEQFHQWDEFIRKYYEFFKIE